MKAGSERQAWVWQDWEGGWKEEGLGCQISKRGGRGVALASCSPPARAWLEILPLAQAQEQAQSLGFALGGCSVL